MSIREGFGLTVAEALWKGTPVVARRVGGIPLQIKDGLNGFLIDSEEEAAARVVQLMRDESLRRKLGAEARKSTMKKFLMIRLLENYLDLMASFVPEFKLRPT
jgi:trehalose synthase